MRWGGGARGRDSRWAEQDGEDEEEEDEDDEAEEDEYDEAES